MKATIHIPPAALEAGALVIFLADEDTPFGDTARATFVAMVEAWEGRDIVRYPPPEPGTDLILPITQTQEDGDGK